MIPKGMFENYKTYKQDTFEIANWLAKNAIACGCDFAVQSKSKRSKKQQHGDKVIAIRDFVTLATFLANHSVAKLTKESCSAFLEKLDAVIDARNAHNRWYNDHVQKNDQLQDTHVFFVNLLQEVRSLLHDLVARASESVAVRRTGQNGTPLRKPVAGQRRMPKNLDIPPPSKELRVGGPETPDALPNNVASTFPHFEQKATMRDSATDSGADSILTNRFAHLEVEETPQIGESVTKLTSSQTKHMSKPIPEFKVEAVKDEQEVWLAARCFFEELGATRLWVNEAFQLCMSEKMPIWLASIIAHVASDLVHRAELEFEEEFETSDLPELMRQVHAALVSELKGYDASLVKESFPDSFDLETWLTDEPTMLPAMGILESFRGIEKPWMRTFGATSFPSHSMTHPHNFVSNHAYEKNFRYIESMFADLSFAAHAIPDYCCADQLTGFVSEFLGTKRVSIAAGFALQLVLDMKLTMDSNLSSGLDEYRLHAYIAFSSVWRMAEIHQLSFKVAMRKTATDRFHETIKSVHSIHDYDMIEAERIRHKQLPRGYLRNQMLEAHPLLCGTLTFKTRFVLAKESIEWVNSSTATLKLLHLYNACRAEGFLTEEWRPMEDLIDLYSARHLFVGDRPDARADYYRRFCLAMGCSPRYFAREGCCTGSKKRTNPLPVREPRAFDLRNVAPTLSQFFERLNENERAMIEVMFQFDRSLESEMEKGASQNDTVEAEDQEQDPSANYPGRVKQFILHRLFGAVRTEWPVVIFDYLSVDRVCVAMLEVLARELEP